MNIVILPNSLLSNWVVTIHAILGLRVWRLLDRIGLGGEPIIAVVP